MFSDGESRSFTERLDRGDGRQRVEIATLGEGERQAGTWGAGAVGRITQSWARGRRGRGRGEGSCWRLVRRLVRRLVWGKKSSVIFDLSKTIWVVVQVGKQHPLLVVGSTEDLVLVQIELITNTEPASRHLKPSRCWAGSYLCPHCWQAKHSRWQTFVLALITISKAGMTLLQAEQQPVEPNSLKGRNSYLASSPCPTANTDLRQSLLQSSRFPLVQREWPTSPSLASQQPHLRQSSCQNRSRACNSSESEPGNTMDIAANA